jgi:hypothetical protein
VFALLPWRCLHAQAGPPFLTNDAGTPGNANWEINVGATQLTSARARRLSCRR